MAELASALVVELIDQVSKTAETVAAALTKMGAAADQAAGHGAHQASQWQTAVHNVGHAFERVEEAQNNLLGAWVGFKMVGEAIAEPVKAAREFEGALLRLNMMLKDKGNTPEALANIRAEILEISRTLPVTAEEAAKMYQVFAGHGHPLSAFKELTEQTVKWAAALKMGPEDLAERLSQTERAANLTEEELKSLVDTVVILHNRTGTSVEDLLQVTNTIGAAGKAAGLTVDQTAALAAGFQAAGVSVGASQLAIAKLTGVLTAGEGATKDQVRWLAALGFSATDLAKSMQTDAIGTIEKFIAKLANMGDRETVVTAMNKLLGAGPRGAAKSVADMMTNFQKFVETIQLLDDPGRAGSAMDAFNKQMASSGAKIDLLMQQFENLQVSLGHGLVKVLGDASAQLKGFVDVLNEIIEGHPDLAGWLVTVAGGLAAFNVSLAVGKWLWSAVALGGQVLAAAFAALALPTSLPAFGVAAAEAAPGVAALSAAIQSFGLAVVGWLAYKIAEKLDQLYHWVQRLKELIAMIEGLATYRPNAPGVTQSLMSPPGGAVFNLPGAGGGAGGGGPSAVPTGGGTIPIISQNDAWWADPANRMPWVTFFKASPAAAADPRYATIFQYLVAKGYMALPGRAGGGPVSGGGSYIVGENGPEIFTPGTGGKITPYAALGPKMIQDLMGDYNLTKEQAAGIVGNLGYESGGFEQFWNLAGSGAAGWGQWMGPRRNAFFAYAKQNNLDPRSYAANYGFMKTEREFARGLAQVRRTNSIEDAAAVFEQTFEISDKTAYQDRANWGRKALGLPPGRGSDRYAGGGYRDIPGGARGSRGRGGGGGFGGEGGDMAGGPSSSDSSMMSTLGGISVTLNFYGPTDASDAATQVRSAMDNYVTETFQGIYSDTGMRFA